LINLWHELKNSGKSLGFAPCCIIQKCKGFQACGKDCPWLQRQVSKPFCNIWTGTERLCMGCRLTVYSLANSVIGIPANSSIVTSCLCPYTVSTIADPSIAVSATLAKDILA